MSEEIYNETTEPLYDFILAMVGGVMLLHFVSVVIVIIAVVFLFLKSNRPGTKAMLIGTLLALSFYIASYFFDNYGYNFDNDQFISWCLSLAQALSILIASWGFLKFSRSFNNPI